jgi:hypothetical protein
MVSERRLAERMESYWGELTPNLSAAVRRLNLDGYESEHPPIKSKAVHPSRMFLVSEVAFETLARLYPVAPGMTEVGKTVFDYAQGVIDRFAPPDSNADISPEFSNDEVMFAAQLGEAMQRLLIRTFKQATVVFRPNVSGHGIVDSVELDAISSDTLIEFKATERPLSSADLRQVLIYLCLMHFAGTPASRVMLYNPRQGRSYTMSSMDLILSVSGVSDVEFFHRCSDVFARLLLEEQR